jgi:hypothetical protein
MNRRVSVPHIPTPLEQLGARPFSFYPAIRNLGHNEWLFRCARGDEIQVMNTKSSEQLWIPRRFLGGVSSSEEPVVIVGLVKELEYREGIVAPRVLRVIEMPRAVNDIPRPAVSRTWINAPRPGHLAPVEGIRVEESAGSRKGRRLLGMVATGILTCIVGMVMFRDGPLSSRARFFNAPPRLALPFTAQDNYMSVVDKLGRPDGGRSRTAPDGREFFLLRYPDRSFTVVLLGRERDDAFYVGALGRGGRVVHSVALPDGRDSAELLSHWR